MAAARLVLSSVDGVEWTFETGLNVGSGWFVAATRDRDNDLVLIGYAHEPLPADCQQSNSSQRYRCLPTWCEVVWTGPIGNIARRNLECTITGVVPTAVATLADGRVLVTDTGGRLWIRD